MSNSLFTPDEGRKKKAPGRAKKKSQGGSEDEAGEETDEGDMESREVDYMSDTSSDSEHEFQVSKIHNNYAVGREGEKGIPSPLNICQQHVSKSLKTEILINPWVQHSCISNTWN